MNKIVHHYNRCPYFEIYFPFVSQTLQECRQFEKFSEASIFIVKKFLKLLSFNYRLEISSKLPVSGYKTDYVINIVEYLEGDVYLSGSGASAYQTEEEFESARIKLAYQDFYHYLEQHPYNQICSPFINGLSIIDPLFNIGIEGFYHLLSDYAEKLKFSEEL